MTKVPRPGEVKTRLTPPLTPTEAAQLNVCFLKDLCGAISQATHQTLSRGVAIYTPSGSEAAYTNILPLGFSLIPQRGESFEDRLIFAAEDLFTVGFESVCLINSDSPTVSDSSFVEAANELAKPHDRIVLGPSVDGGYYLIGLKKLHRRVFENIDWSTDRVFGQTKERAAEIGVDVHELPVGLDVDDHSSLRQLYRELLEKPSRTRGVAPHTHSFLETLRVKL